MWRLICYECKKLVCHRSGICILFVLFLICGWQLYTDIDFQKNTVDLEQITKFQKNAEGSYASMKERLAKQEDTKDMYQLNANRELDENRMASAYGRNWKDVAKAYEQGTLTYELLEQSMNALSDEEGRGDDEAAKKAWQHFELLYYYVDDMDMGYALSTLPEIDKFLNPQTYVYTKENAKDAQECIASMCNMIKDESTRDEINRRFLAADTTYTSTYASEMIYQQTSYTNFLLLICLAVLLGNVYSRETAAKTDIYLATSIKGSKQTMWAKCVVTLFFGVVVPLLFKLVAMLMVMKSYPIAWDALSGSQIVTIPIPYVFTFKELFLYSMLNYAIGLFALCICFMAISYVCKNSYLSAVIALLFVIVPIYYEVMALGDVHVEQWLPSNMLMRFNEHLSITSNNQGNLFINFFGTAVPSITKFWLFSLAVSALLLSGIRWRIKQHITNQA